jgi:Na+-driven multidrug efflux pump
MRRHAPRLYSRRMSNATSTLPAPADRLTQGRVLPVMLSLALPNMVAMVSAAAVSIAETAYVGALGRDALAAMAVVFPFVMLMQTVSGGAIGGAISAAVSRALGAQRDDAAHSLALHATLIGLAGGAIFLVLFLLLGPLLYGVLGARDAVLQQALLYSNVVFLGAPLTWQLRAPAWGYFALVSAAMVAYGLFNAGALARTDWRAAAGTVRPRP